MARTAFTRIGSTSLALSDVDFDRAMQGQDSNVVAQFNKVQSKVRHQLRKSAALRTQSHDSFFQLSFCNPNSVFDIAGHAA